MTPEEVDKLSDHAALLWGTNVIETGSRAREKLGWVPKGRSLADELPAMIKQEAIMLGMIKSDK
jgi:hypothetical protein